MDRKRLNRSDPVCIVIGCSNAIHNPTVKYFPVPVNNESVCRQWYTNTLRDELTPSPNHYVCQEHFDEESFQNVDDSSRADDPVLKASAVPSLFELEVFHKMLEHQETVNCANRTSSSVTFHGVDQNVDMRMLEPLLKPGQFSSVTTNFTSSPDDIRPSENSVSDLLASALSGSSGSGSGKSPDTTVTSTTGTISSCSSNQSVVINKPPPGQTVEGGMKVLKCQIMGCSNHYMPKREAVPLFNLPRDPVLATKWLRSCCREDVQFNTYTRFKICREHFRAEDFNQDGSLKSLAVPNVFTEKCVELQTRLRNRNIKRRMLEEANNPHATHQKQTESRSTTDNTVVSNSTKKLQKAIKHPSKSNSSSVPKARKHTGGPPKTPFRRSLSVEELTSMSPSGSSTKEEITDLTMTCEDDDLSNVQLQTFNCQYLLNPDSNVFGDSNLPTQTYIGPAFSGCTEGDNNNRNELLGRKQPKKRKKRCTTEFQNSNHHLLKPLDKNRRNYHHQTDFDDVSDPNMGMTDVATLPSAKRGRRSNFTYAVKSSSRKRVKINKKPPIFVKPEPTPKASIPFLEPAFKEQISPFPKNIPIPRLKPGAVRTREEGLEVHLEKTYRDTLKKYYGRKPGTATETVLSEHQCKCPVCNEIVANNIQLSGHICNHIEGEDAEIIFNKALNTSCSYCDQTFETPFELVFHYDTTHMHEIKEYRCRICEQTHGSLLELIAHLNLCHCGLEMPYRCEVCSYRTSFYADILFHIRKFHCGSDKFFCPYCLKTLLLPKTQFSNVCNGTTAFHHLIQHYNKYEGTKLTLSKCKHCRKCVLHLRMIKDHIRRDHPNIVAGAKASYFSDDDGMLAAESYRKPGRKKFSRLTNNHAQGNENAIDNNENHMRNNQNSLEEDHFDNQPRSLRCIECEKLLSVEDYAHFSFVQRCSLCNYVTSCSVSLAFHENGHHDQDIHTLGRQGPIIYALKCSTCPFSTHEGALMATHLAITECTCCSCVDVRRPLEQQPNNNTESSSSSTTTPAAAIAPSSSSLLIL